VRTLFFRVRSKKGKIQTKMGWFVLETLTRQKRRRTCVAMVEKFPEYAVYSAKMVLERSLRVAATNAYMSGMTLCRVQKERGKNEDQRKAPLFFLKAKESSIE